MSKYTEEELNQALEDTGRLLQDVPLTREYDLDDILAEFGTGAVKPQQPRPEPVSQSQQPEPEDPAPAGYKGQVNAFPLLLCRKHRRRFPSAAVIADVQFHPASGLRVQPEGQP